jgi:hypothetical protein
MAKSTLDKTEEKIEEFAEDLGRLLGTARAKAEGWIGQRQRIAKQLSEISETAAGLYQQLMGGSAPAPQKRRGRKPKAAKSTAAKSTAAPKRRQMSADARRRISEAQKKRWAAQRGAAKK